MGNALSADALDQLRVAFSETGDPAAETEERVRALVAAESARLLGYFLRRTQHAEDAADLVGEVFLVLWRRADDLPKRGVEARMWLYGIAGLVLSTYRRGGIRRSALTEELRKELATRTQEHPAVPDDESQESVRAALLALQPRDREIVTLVHWDGFSLVEVAKILGLKPVTVRSRYARARGRLRAILAPYPSSS
jgi:RNA polymerase sigma-70 factor (ECF subfamily)